MTDLTKADRIIARRLANEIIDEADSRSGGPDPMNPDDPLFLLARLVTLLIARGQRMLTVYAAGMDYARAIRTGALATHNEWLGLRTAALAAERAEVAEGEQG